MTRPAVILNLGRKNWYSFVPLVNSLECSGIDAEITPSRNVFKDLDAATVRNEPVICCVSYFTTQIAQTRQMVTRVRARYADGVHLVAGGPHPSGAPRDALRSGFDCVVRGEGEEALPGVVRRIVEGEYARGSTIVDGEPLDNLDNYSPVSFRHHLYPPIEISRGCLFGCRYCGVPSFVGPLRHRSIGSVVEAAARLVKLRENWDFRFISPNSLGYGSETNRPNERAIEGLLSALKELDGGKRIYFATFPSEGRPDYVTDRVVEIIDELADNRRVSIGAQSGSKRMLESICRGHTLTTVYEACDIILSGGLTPVVDFILGLPDETFQDQEDTLCAMRRIVKSGGEVRAHHFLPLAGSPMEARAPSEISPTVLGEIGRLSLHGAASGSFTEQMRLAREIVRWQDLSGLSRRDRH